MTLYHEVTRDSFATVLRSGLKRTSRGKKGDESDIQRTDDFLDHHLPAKLKEAGVQRDDNIYAYIGTDNQLIDIRTGHATALADHPDPASALLRLAVHPRHCYVSDLDRYDAVKAAVARHSPDTKRLAAEYWQHIIPLATYTAGAIQRPEVMITTDIPADAITHIKTV